MVSISASVAWWARTEPARTALVYEGSRITYGELQSRVELVAGLLAALAALASPAWAQADFPNRPIRLIVTVPPGWHLPAVVLSRSACPPDLTRVGNVGFGTNVGLLTFVGTLLQDVAVPGAHITLGRSLGDLAGDGWTSDENVALLVRRADVAVDGTPLLVRSRYIRGLTSPLTA